MDKETVVEGDWLDTVSRNHATSIMIELRSKFVHEKMADPRQEYKKWSE